MERYFNEMGKEMKSLGIKKNFLYQFLYQVIILIVPLILSKYVTHAITNDALGVYSYSYSIASIFVILAMLGIQKYGTREIARVKDNPTELRRTFWGLYLLHFIFSVFSITLYLIVCFFVSSGERAIFFIQAVYVASAIFDITWLYYGLENFKSVVIKNLVVKVLEVFLIIFLVKSNADVWKYTLIMAGSVFIGQLIVIPTAVHHVHPIAISFSDIKHHILPLFMLSISVVAASIYAYLDKTLIGLLSKNGKSDVAIYEYSEKVVRIPLGILTVLGTVMLPRMSSLALRKDVEEEKRMISTSLTVISFLSIGALFGIISISEVFVTLWYGSSYQDCSWCIVLMAPIIFFIAFGDIIRSEYLIPMKKDFAYIISIVAGAITNLVLNLFLIPLLGLRGAIIGTLFAEASICLTQLFFCKNQLPIKSYLLIPIPFLFSGAVILSFNNFIQNVMGVSYLTLVVQIITGFVLYVALCFAFFYLFDKHSLVFFKTLLKTKKK